MASKCLLVDVRTEHRSAEWAPRYVGGGGKEKGQAAAESWSLLHIQPWNSEDAKFQPVLAFKVITKAYVSECKDRTYFI